MTRVKTGAGGEVAVPAVPPRSPAPATRVTPFTVLGVGAVLLASVVARFVVSSDLWLDEALSVNIARLPISELREALERDGAPPLFYVLLHCWMEVLGSSDLAVRAMSAVLSIATFPAMYFAGRRLGGRFAAWSAVLVFATSPYAIRYATEARMYALVMFLVAWGYLAVVRALEHPSLGRCALVALVAAMLLYAHNWSWYLIGVVAAIVGVRAWRGASREARRAPWRVLVALVVGVASFAPWVPTFRYQLAHTGTPWGDARLPWSGFASAMSALGGVGRPYHGEADVMAWVVVVLSLLGVFGRPVDARHVDLDLRTRAATRWEAAVGFGTIAVGLVLSYAAGTAFEARYAAVGAPLVLLVITMGVTVFASPAIRAGVLVAVVVLGLAGGARNALDDRTQAGQVASVIAAEAREGDVVLYCPDQLGPATHRALGSVPGLREMTFPDLAGPEFVDWVDYRERIAATDPDEVARRVLRRAGDATIWYVVSPGYRSVEGKCELLAAALAAARPQPVGHLSPEEIDFYEFMGLVEYPAS